MPEPVQTGERGVHRFRSVFFSEEGRLTPCGDPSAAFPRLRERMRESASRHRAMSYLIVDCRLLASGSSPLSLFPAELRERLARMDGKGGEQAEARVSGYRPLSLRRLLPLIVGAAGAAASFWVFFHRAL